MSLHMCKAAEYQLYFAQGVYSE